MEINTILNSQGNCFSQFQYKILHWLEIVV